jgi:hypothetical protein
MRALLATALLSAFACARAGAAPAAEVPPLSPQVRASVVKALPFLEKEGVKWHEDKTCLSCHHIPFMTWSHLDASRRGLSVDPDKLKEWLAWCVEWAEPKGGDDVLGELLVFFPREVVPAPEGHKKFESLPEQIVKKQKPDGSWQASGQFRGEKWPAAEADQVTTMLMLLGLNTPWTDAAQTAAAREKALAWLKVNDAPQATRSSTMRLWFDHRTGDSSRKEALTQKLLSQQKPDGGWSWRIDLEGSDPIATGEVLYVLGAIGSPTWDAASRQRAIEYLVKTQREDGSWYQDHKRISASIRKEPQKITTIDGIYTYYASGWATMGLLQMLPATALADTSVARE